MKAIMNYEKGFSNYIEAIQKDRDDILQQHYDDGERFENKGIYIGAIPHARFFLYSFPLIEGIKYKSYNALRWLLEHRADVNLQTETDKKTPYQVAFDEGDEKIREIFKIPVSRKEEIKKRKGRKELFEELGISKKTKSEKKRILEKLKNRK